LQFAIVLIHVNRRPGRLLQLRGAADVIDMRMRDDNRFHLKIMPPQYLQNIFDLIARIDDHRLARLLIPENRAITLQRTDGQDLVDHSYTLQ
jgi:hypothetical protein